MEKSILFSTKVSKCVVLSYSVFIHLLRFCRCHALSLLASQAMDNAPKYTVN